MVQNPDKQPFGLLKWLEAETRVWENEGIISDEQARAIVGRYKHKAEEEHGSRLITVLAVIGALLLGIGVILFFASNWQAIPKWVKVALILGSIIAANGSGYYLAFEKQTYPRVGKSLIFLGSILYGSGIWLIAQIFHISSHYPNGLLFWAAGLIPIIVTCGLHSILIQASLLFTAWTFTEQTGFQNYNWLFLPFAVGIIYLAYRLKSRIAVGLTLPGIAIWLAIGSVISLKEGEIKAVLFTILLIVQAGLLIYAGGLLQSLSQKFSPMRLPYKIAGLLLTLGGLYLISFRWLVDGIHYEPRDFNFSAFYLASYAVTVVVALITTIVSLFRDRGEKHTFREGVFLILLVIAAAGLSVSAQFLSHTVFLLLTNIILFLVITAVIVIGYQNREPVLINFGLVFFVLDVIARYFDFFWDMLDKSVFFMIGGVLLILGGTLLERNRRKVLREMKVNDYAA